MDFLKKASQSFSGSSKTTQPKPADGAAPAQKDDYGDKAAAFLNKQSGGKLNKDQTEKVTDGLRGFYEKATGKKVDPKYSN